MGTGHSDWDEEYSVVSDRGDVGFLDFEDERSFQNIDPLDEEGPVVIPRPFPFVRGKPISVLIGERTAYAISIKNTTHDHVDLWSVRIFSENPEGTYLLSLMKPPTSDANEETTCSFVASTALEERTLQPGETFIIWLSCKPKEIGLHTAVVHFNVADEIVERVAFLLAEDKVSQALFSTKPYSRASSRGSGRRSSYDQYVAGSRPPRAPTQGFFKNKLPQYSIPKDIREIVENKQAPDVITEGLYNGNYATYFRTLIVMEEIHMEEEMRAHDMERVSMKRKGNYFLSLEVPGLAEKRPSLVYGDFIFARLVTDDQVHDTPAYQGFIHRVEADEIFLKFDKSLHARHQDCDLYNVSFTYNRINMRRLYLAIEAAERLGPSILFPSQLSYRVIKTFSLMPLNPHINKEQARAVEMILGCRGGEPYIILGPPGTGKTMTIVEAIRQIYTNRKRARILVCASSNSAADHVLEKLLDHEGVKVKESEIFRLNATSRPYDDIKPDFLRFCFFDDAVFKCPPLKALVHYRIIISTYMSSSLLYSEGIPKGHFSHIFLDEAGQASEPESMVPISNMCEKNCVIVLAGDPKQLGPVIYSRDAESYGLGKSYMERLFECEGYEDADENYLTKLVRNYRSHPSILELPSKLFYKGELIACKEEDESDIFDSFDLPNKNFPVLFVGIQGCDEREGNNPSWFNRIEASKVVEIIRKLMGCTDLDESDIGVITPYRQQVLKLKKALEVLEMPDVKVGSVEQFQGQERKVIIISTVRSTVKHNEFDRVHNLGFLSNPRRFNVAITRARSLLIIVGNPHILTKDPHWDRLLRYCADNGSYQGCPLPPPEDNYHPVGEETEYDGGQPHSNGNEWGNVPDQSNYVNELGESEWDNNAKPYCNGDGWGDCASQSYSNEAGWSDSAPNQYKGSGWDDNHPKVQATGWGDVPSASGWDDVPPASGWDDTPPASGCDDTPPASGWDDMPPASGWDDNHPKVQATGWDDMPPASGWDDQPSGYTEASLPAKAPVSRLDGGPSSSRRISRPCTSQGTEWSKARAGSGWNDGYSSRGDLPLPPKMEATEWDD